MICKRMRGKLRSSILTGFRAPTLHQIYSQKLQYSFVAGQGIQVTGLINNVSPQARVLGIPSLDNESSVNFTMGMGGRISDNFNFTVDYYNISIKDRIVLSGDIKGTDINSDGINIGTTPLDDILRNSNLNSVSFFINALDTRTSGLDVVLNYNNLQVWNGVVDLDLSGNYTIENRRTGEVNNPGVIEGGGQSVFDETQQTSIFSSRPKTKWIFGTDYTKNKIRLSLNNTYFGKAIFKNPGLNNNLRVEFEPKIVTDININYEMTKNVKLAFNINNVFNALPKWAFRAENSEGESIMNDTSVNSYGLTPIEEQSNLITFNQRYSQSTYLGFHFSQVGTVYNLSISYHF